MTAIRDAIALVREIERGNTDAMADILEFGGEGLVGAQIEVAAVLAELVAAEAGGDPRDEMRSAIAQLVIVRDDFGSFLEAILTGEKGTTVPYPPSADERFEQASLLAIIKVGGVLARRFAQLSQTNFDQTMARLQLQLAAE